MGLFVKPIRDDLGWSATGISIGFVIGSFAGGIAAIFTGRLLDKLGARWVSVAAGLVMTVAMFGLAAMTQVWHFWILFGTARGAAASGAQMGTMVSLASWYVRKRGRMVGLISTGQRGGQALLPLPIFAIMADVGWRWAWVMLALLVVLLLVIPSGLFVRRRPEDYGLVPDGEEVESQAQAEARADELEETWTLAEARRTRTLWALIIGQGGVVLSLNAANLHIAANFQERGISQAFAVVATTIFAAVSTASVIPWGLVMERLHTRYVAVVSTSLFFVAMALASVGDSIGWAVTFAITYGIGLGAWTVVSRMLFANYFGRRSFGTIRGFSMPIITTMSATGPIFAGVVRDITGSYSLAFQTFAVVFIVSTLAFFFAKPVSKARTGAAPAPE